MSAKLKPEDFLTWLRNKNQNFANGEFIVVGTYVDYCTPIECVCAKCGHRWKPSINSLSCGRGCPECAKFKRSAWKKWSNEEFLTKLSELNNGIIPLEEYKSAKTKMRFACKFGHIWETKPQNVINGHDCPYCAGKKAWVGENDLCTTHPDIVEILKRTEDGYKYSQGSGKIVEFVCPLCGHVSKKRIRDVCKQGFSCPVCSDGVSYPNKFGRAFLSQLPIDSFECEWQPNWAKPYRYDNYFEYNGIPYILEMDGGFHYIEKPVFGLTLEERQRIDSIKTNLAHMNGINIIRIECLKSECDHIKNNIFDSELNMIFDLSNVDWLLCDKNAQKNLVKEACSLYCDKLYSINEIANVLKIKNCTVIKYLKSGTKFGWCDYAKIYSTA